MNEYEQSLLDACVKDLAGNIKKGVAFGESKSPPVKLD